MLSICFSDDIVIYVFNVHLVKFLFPFLLFLFSCLLPYGEIKMNMYDDNTRPSETDRQTNIMAIARRLVLTNASRANNSKNPIKRHGRRLQHDCGASRLDHRYG